VVLDYLVGTKTHKLFKKSEVKLVLFKMLLLLSAVLWLHFEMQNNDSSSKLGFIIFLNVFSFFLFFLALQTYNSK